jgi:predicted NAD/FAD-binding protein
MKTKSSPPSPVHVSRRDAIKGGAGLGAAGLLGCGSGAGERQSRTIASAVDTPRVAIIGAGAGGIAAAYFLAGDCDVTIFEAADHIGGHADNAVVTYQNQPLTVAVGAEFFHPATHPIYVALLEELGLFNAANPGTDDQTIAAPGSLCIAPVGGWLPTFSSKFPELTPLRAVDFAIYAQLARSAVLGNMSWDTTVGDWVAGLPVAASFKQAVALPWLTSLIGSSSADAAVSSARSILQTVALAFPANPFQGATTYNSKIGLQGNLQTILSASPGVSVQLRSPVQGLSYGDGTWRLTTPAGAFGPFDAVVVNAPPQKSAGLLAPLAWAADIAAILARYQFFDTRIVIHTDPAYVFWDRDFWSAANAGVTGTECENSVWLGALLPPLPSGGTVDVFKSWVNRRKRDPKNILAEGYYEHPHITSQTLQAARDLRGVQGRNGLHFSGTYTMGMDTQESAVYAAMKVAAQIAPSSATLASLDARLQAKGLTGVSYDP